jgi:GxxExxY protein
MITQKYINQLAYNTVGCAIEVHRELGPGLLESVYERCLIYELQNAGFEIQSQVRVPVIYKSINIDCDLRLDLIVNDLIIVELKSVEIMHPIFQAQLLTYLRLLEKPKGLLINFNCDNISSHLVPLVTSKFASLPKE